MQTCPNCGDARPVEVGDVLDGYCGGAFGRDSYDRKVVEGVGPDWVVARDELRGPVVAIGDDVRVELAEHRQAG